MQLSFSRSFRSDNGRVILIRTFVEKIKAVHASCYWDLEFQKKLVQWCRNHKRKNVLDYVPDSMKETARATMSAACRLDCDEGTARLEELAKMLMLPRPSAAGSFREGLAERFAVNRFGLTAASQPCLSTTNVIGSANSGIRRRTGRVPRWTDGSMVLRWVGLGAT